ncbi:MAG: PEGA domain-containing protein [Candidatus Omnitrophica bacterium]|nr:PEGA domain-containing protein [Candidatus Omnitrophota bacterium]
MSTQQTAYSGQEDQPINRFICVLCAVCCLLITGCLHRSLTIKSNPPGAVIFVNDHKMQGVTPYTYDFEWYGWHRIALVKDGYERTDDLTLLKAPPYMWIPFDLVMEVVPFQVRDNRVLSYQLAPTPELNVPKPPALPPRELPPDPAVDE